MNVKIMFNIIASIFDYNPNVATCMKPEMWKRFVSLSEILYELFFIYLTMTFLCLVQAKFEA